MKITRPKYGWTDLGGRAGAWVALAVSLVNLSSGTPWGIAWLGFALGMFACVHVERLRQDLGRRSSPRAQCTTPIYSGHLGPPERCAYPEGHEGACES